MWNFPPLILEKALVFNGLSSQEGGQRRSVNSFGCILPPTLALYLWYLLGLGGEVITKTVSYSDLVS